MVTYPPPVASLRDSSNAKSRNHAASPLTFPATVAPEMVVCGNKVEILRQGIDYEDWRLGIQLAINGKVATMFDLHKSKIAETGDGTPAYEELLYQSASALIAQFGSTRPGVPSASPR